MRFQICSFFLLINLQITLKEFESLLVKLQTDPTHNFQGGNDDITSKMRAEIKALLKFADKDKSGTITFNVWIRFFVFFN